MYYGRYPCLEQVKKILVIKMRHHGDVLLTSPVFSSLKKALPSTQVDALIYQDTESMLKGNPSISKIFCYDKKWKKLSFFSRIVREITLLLHLRKERYDLVLNLTEGDRGALVGLISGAKDVVGFDPGNRGFLGKRKVYSHFIKSCRTPRHAVERNLDAVRRLGIYPESKDLHLSIDADAQSRMEKLLEHNHIQKKGYILIHPGSRWLFKTLPASLVASFIKYIHQKGFPIVLTGSPDSLEGQYIQKIVESIPHIPMLNCTGKTSLEELAFLIKEAQVLFTVDTVALHMGSCFHTPLVGVFGPTSFIEWGPWNHPKAEIVSLGLSCQPCGLDGCGGSKVSDCLRNMPILKLTEAFERVLRCTSV